MTTDNFVEGGKPRCDTALPFGEARIESQDLASTRERIGQKACTSCAPLPGTH